MEMPFFILKLDVLFLESKATFRLFNFIKKWNF